MPDSSSISVRIENAIHYNQSGEYELAIDQMDKALNRDLKNAEVWFQKGLGHFGLRKFEFALKCFERAIILDSTQAKFFLHQGIAYLQNDEIRKSHKNFEFALKVANNHSDSVLKCKALYWSAKALEKEDKIPEAKAKFIRANQICPDDENISRVLLNIKLDSLYSLATTAIEENKLNIANSILRDIIVTDSNYKNALSLLRKNINVLESEKEDSGRSKKTKKSGPAKVVPEAISQNDTLTSNTDYNRPISDIGENTVEALQVNSQASFYGNVDWYWWFTMGGVVLAMTVFILNRRKKQPGAQTIEFQSTYLRHINEIKPEQFPEQSRYRIDAELGVGSMGRVYKAYDLQLDRPVAIKLIRFENTTDDNDLDERIERFRREARATAKLDHHNIVSLYDYNEKEHAFYMTMEYVDGESLKRLLGKQKQLSIEKIIFILQSVLSALDYAHKKQIVHRDIKPSNIMLTASGKVKVLDFGLAKLLDHTLQDARTITGSRLGSPAYMSPEQINAEKIDERTDIFSLGVVLYEMLTQQNPFKTETEGNLTKLFYEILNTDPVLPSSIRKDVPDFLDAILAKMLAKDKIERFDKPGAILNVLEENHNKLTLET